nr:transposase domain-containing protein [Pseudomonas helleri]
MWEVGRCVHRSLTGQEPYAWLRHALERLPHASSVEDFEALLPWNCTLQTPR